MYNSVEEDQKEKNEAQEVEVEDESVVGNRAVDISEDEYSVKVSLKTSNNRYVEAIDYIHAFLEQK